MFTISVERHFRASHQLTLPDGSKESVHSHDWVVIANLSSEKLNNMGVVMDFQILKAKIDKTVAGFNHKALDSNDYFQQHNPSRQHRMQKKRLLKQIQQQHRQWQTLNEKQRKMLTQD